MKLALYILFASCGMQLANSQDFLNSLPAIRSPQLAFPPGFQVFNIVPLAPNNSPAGIAPNSNPNASGDPFTIVGETSPEEPRGQRQTGPGGIPLIEISPGVFIRGVSNDTIPRNPDDNPADLPTDEDTTPKTSKPNRARSRRIRPIRVNIRAPTRKNRARKIRPIQVNIRAPASTDVPFGGYGGHGGGKPSFEVVRANNIANFELDSPNGYQGKSQFSNGKFPGLTVTDPGNFPLITADPAEDEPLDDDREDEESEEPPTTARGPPQQRGNGRRIIIRVIRPPTRIE